MIGLILAAALGAAASRPLDKLDKRIKAADRQRPGTGAARDRARRQAAPGTRRAPNPARQNEAEAPQMKRLSSRNKLAARPVSDVAAPIKPNGLGTPAKAIPQWREWRLSPWAALTAILFVIAVLLCEPAGVPGWLKALAAGRHRPRRRLRHRQDGNRPMEGGVSPASFKIMLDGPEAPPPPSKPVNPAALTREERHEQRLARPVYRVGAGLAVDPLHRLRVLRRALLCQRHHGRHADPAGAFRWHPRHHAVHGRPADRLPRSIAKANRPWRKPPSVSGLPASCSISRSWGISPGTGRKLRRRLRKRLPALP